uniref:Uncharacterized protein n=1 Tax=Nelumbo nucifera TaxID=4432 RepID=A0A822ZQX0_NELNU|nr:TPA_asm: hypothetical protein HUJ06_017200 [Nelumbo nucifera]
MSRGSDFLPQTSAIQWKCRTGKVQIIQPTQEEEEREEEEEGETRGRMIYPSPLVASSFTGGADELLTSGGVGVRTRVKRK